LLVQCLHAAFELLVEIADVRGQQTMEVKYVAFVIGEGCAFVETRRIDQVKSGK
jgi:hypothetical protein